MLWLILKVHCSSIVSIARRLLDPLAELVKIEPKHIGVGQYQVSLIIASSLKTKKLCMSSE